MENAFTAEPLWSREQFILRPAEDLVDLRNLALEIAIQIQKSDGLVPSAPDDIIKAIMSTTKILVHDDNTTRSNSILSSLSVACRRVSSDPMSCVDAALCLWYMSAVPLVLRDPEHGLPPDSEIEYDEGVAILRWNREYASEQQHVANLGLVAMVLTADLWSRPAQPGFEVATLISNAVTSILYAIQIIVATGKFESAWTAAATSTDPGVASKIFIRTALNIARVGCDKFDAGPGSEFGALQNEIKLSENARHLLSKVGRDDWSVVPVWHPCRRVPGSQWNKFMRNTRRTFFGDGQRKKTDIVYQLPSSILSLSEPWQVYYTELRSRFDAAKRTRKQLSSEERRRQFARLARETGNVYRYQTHNEQETRDVEQEYLFNLPMIKKPIADTKGNTTAPFLTTVARALRFEVETDETEMDFFMMTFSEPCFSN